MNKRDGVHPDPFMIGEILAFLPSKKGGEIKRRTCSTCGHYFPSIAGKERHRKAFTVELLQIYTSHRRTLFSGGLTPQKMHPSYPLRTLSTVSSEETE